MKKVFKLEPGWSVSLIAAMCHSVCFVTVQLIFKGKFAIETNTTSNSNKAL